jgi:hypothetical protein
MGTIKFLGTVCSVFAAIIIIALAPVSTVFAQETLNPNAPVPTATTTTAQAGSSTSTATTTEAAVLVPAQRPYAVESLSGTNLAVGDFVVGPGRIEVEVKPGETVTRMISVTNRISGERTFQLGVEDMSGSADASAAVVLLGDKNGPYTLKDNISFSSKTFTLNLGERAQVPISITMPPNAEPGGYYGAVVVSTIQNSKSDTENAGAKSPIIARIGTLFFITVPGETNYAGSVTNFSTKNNQWWFEKGPIDLNILYENTGAIHLNPYGEVTVTNMLGEQVGFVDLEPWFVLPKSLRSRTVTWDRELLFGRYTITAKINRGYGDIIDEKVIHIWVLPWKILAAVFVGLVLIISLLRFIFSSFEFKRKGR